MNAMRRQHSFHDCTIRIFNPKLVRVVHIIHVIVSLNILHAGGVSRLHIATNAVTAAAGAKGTNELKMSHDGLTQDPRPAVKRYGICQVIGIPTTWRIFAPHARKTKRSAEDDLSIRCYVKEDHKYANLRV